MKQIGLTFAAAVLATFFWGHAAMAQVNSVPLSFLGMTTSVVGNNTGTNCPAGSPPYIYWPPNEGSQIGSLGKMVASEWGFFQHGSDTSPNFTKLDCYVQTAVGGVYGPVVSPIITTFWGVSTRSVCYDFNGAGNGTYPGPTGSNCGIGVNDPGGTGCPYGDVGGVGDGYCPGPTYQQVNCTTPTDIENYATEIANEVVIDDPSYQAVHYYELWNEPNVPNSFDSGGPTSCTSSISDDLVVQSYWIEQGILASNDLHPVFLAPSISSVDTNASPSAPTLMTDFLQACWGIGVGTVCGYQLVNGSGFAGGFPGGETFHLYLYYDSVTGDHPNCDQVAGQTAPSNTLECTGNAFIYDLQQRMNAVYNSSPSYNISNIFMTEGSWSLDTYIADGDKLAFVARYYLISAATTSSPAVGVTEQMSGMDWWAWPGCVDGAASWGILYNTNPMCGSGTVGITAAGTAYNTVYGWLADSTIAQTCAGGNASACLDNNNSLWSYQVWPLLVATPDYAVWLWNQTAIVTCDATSGNSPQCPSGLVPSTYGYYITLDGIVHTVNASSGVSIGMTPILFVP